MRSLFCAFFMAVLLGGCASNLPVGEAHPGAVSGIHKLEILVIADAKPLRPGVPEPDYDKAPDMIEAIKELNDYDRALNSADSALAPLATELTYANTKAKVVACVRDALVSREITIAGIKSEEYDGSARNETGLEQGAVTGDRGAALLVIIPSLTMSQDYRTLSISLTARVYRPDSTAVAGEAIYDVASMPIASENPIQEWSATGGADFFREITTECGQMGEKVAGMFKGG